MLSITTKYSLFAVEPGRVTVRQLSVALLAILLAAPPANAQTVQRIEETDITLVGSWTEELNGAYSEGRSVYVNFDFHDPGAHATFEFEGTGITWIGLRSFNAGLFEWIIDEGTVDERRDTVNTYIDGVELFTTEVLATDLTPGMHTFKFISLGIHGDTGVFDYPSETYIDAFDVVLPSVQIVEIDIKPGSFPNSINLGSGGMTAVAILGSASLHVNDIDPDTLTLGTAGIKTVGKTARTLCSVVDVSGDFSAGPEGAPDSFLDLVCHFTTMDIAPEAGDTTATISGNLLAAAGGGAIEGTDSVNIVP